MLAKRNGRKTQTKWLTSVLGTMGVVVLAVTLVAPWAAAAEFRPVARESVAPYTPSGMGVAMGAPEAAGSGEVTVRRLPPVSASAYRALKAAAAANPAARGADVLGAPAGPEALSADVTTSFVGLDRPGAANNGFVFFPPDTIVAKSFTRVLEATNSAVRLFTTTGTVIGTSNLNAFFGVSTTNGRLFDPKVYFDRNAANRRFYVVALQKAGTTDASGVSRIWLAISRSSDPASLAAANWCRYNINGKRNAGTSLSSWADYPGLGIGADALVISVNQFTFTGNSFTFAIVRAYRKLVAANNATSCPTIPGFVFQPAGSTVGSGSVFTLQPVQHYVSPSSFTGTTNPAYLLSTIWGTNNAYRVWQVRNVGGTPTLRVVNVTGSFNYGVQPNAPQKGSAVLLDTGDNRMTQAAGRSNLLSGVHGTLCNIGGGATESCVRVVRIIVGQNSSGALTAVLNQQRTFGGGAGVFYYWPGIAVNIVNQTAIAFHRSSSTSYLSSWWTMKDSASTLFESASPFTTGTCAQSSNRTGDYIGAQTDPSGVRSFWLAGERATTIAGSCQWQTQIIKVVPGTEGVNLSP